MCVMSLIMFKFVFASYVFAPFSISLGFVFCKGSAVCFFDLVMGFSICCVTGETNVRVLHGPS